MVKDEVEDGQGGPLKDKRYNRSRACKSIQSDKLIFNYAIRKREPKEKRRLAFLKLQRKVELRQKVARLEAKHREALDEAAFNGAHEGYIMNRIASKPAFMTNDAIAEAARIFAEERERKEKLKSDALNMNNMSQDANSGKLKPILVITKGKLGQKTKKRDVDDDAVRGKDKLQARDIKGMEELHWKVV